LPDDLASEIEELENKLNRVDEDDAYEMMDAQWGLINDSLKKLVANKDKIISH
jgi:hypothetical protein